MAWVLTVEHHDLVAEICADPYSTGQCPQHRPGKQDLHARVRTVTVHRPVTHLCDDDARDGAQHSRHAVQFVHAAGVVQVDHALEPRRDVHVAQHRDAAGEEPGCSAGDNVWMGPFTIKALV